MNYMQRQFKQALVRLAKTYYFNCNYFAEFLFYLVLSLSSFIYCNKGIKETMHHVIWTI